MSKTAPAPWLIWSWIVIALVFAVTETIAIIDGADGSDLTRNAMHIYQTLRAACMTASVAGLILWNIQESRRTRAALVTAAKQDTADAYVDALTNPGGDVRKLPRRGGPA